MSDKHPWRNESVLREKYCDEQKSLSECADELDCSKQTVKNWLDKYGIGAREAPGAGEKEYRDEEKLRELYEEKGHSSIDIARYFGCGKQTVLKYMAKYGIERRKSNHEKPLSLQTNKKGYEYFSGYSGGESFTFRHHRLIAVSEGLLSPEEFIRGEKNVHHAIPIPWLNTHDNLTPLSVDEHARLHDTEREKNELGQYI